MNVIIDFESCLLGETNLETTIKTIEDKAIRRINNLEEKSILRCLYSLKEKKIFDFCGHLRQVIITFRTGFKLNPELFQLVAQHRKMFGFLFDYNSFTVSADPVMFPQDEDLKSAYKLEIKRNSLATIGDGRLYKYYGFTEYKSLSQKLLNYAITNMRPYETLLACLPTGGGKSLSWQMPAISNSYNGLIIVVVPTVSLAMDHERRDRNDFSRQLNTLTYPKAYYSGVPEEEKLQIFLEIEAGILPILYISPEALQGNRFKTIVYSAAAKGKISALVIDEAHLIANWGISFRPEFQLLSSFRNKLKQFSKEGLKTILLSATLTDNDTETIRMLFDEENFTEFRADELRTEPSYYIHQCTDQQERLGIINDLICLVPRPLIIYTVSPDESRFYYDEILKLGFKNVEMFTGKTSNSKRSQIISDWNNDKIDIMIATSAFGMGVDKSDIRTIITAYTPESINRYYQEVGRAGRDGYASLNYFLPCPSIDKDYTNSLTKSLILTAENSTSRWRSLLSTSKREDTDAIWVDINSPPEHLRNTRTGKRNLGWNKSVVLSLYRADLIDIVDIKIINDEDYSILIQLKNIPLLENLPKLEGYISNFREEERKKIRRDIKYVRDLIKSRNQNCFAQYFISQYPYAQEICNGCPYCRKNNLDNYYNKGSIIINSNKDGINITNEYNKTDRFSYFLFSNRNLMLSYDTFDINDINHYIEFLVRSKINIIIYPDIIDKEELLNKLSYFEYYNYILVTLEEIPDINIKWLNGICGLIYTEDDSTNEQLYKFSKEYLEDNEENKIIHICHNELYVNYEGKKLSEICDINLSSEQFIVEGVLI